MATSTQKQAAPWWHGETPIRLDAVSTLIPPRTDGSRVTVSTTYRWSQGGVRGVRLRRFLASGRGFCTTVEEVTRFQAALSALAGGDI